MTLIPPKKILTKAAFMVLLCFCNILTAADQAGLQRRNSFNKLEDLRERQKEAAGERVYYEKREGIIRPKGLMNDITEPGQSSKIIREMEEEFRSDQDAVQNDGTISLEVFLRITDEQIKTVRAVVIPLSESYFTDQRRDTLNHRLSKNQNITVVLDCSGATRIEDKCLNSIKEMHNLKIIHAENVENIGYNFLYDCRGLTTLDLSPLSNVKSIGDRFLYDCTGLTTLDLSPLSNVSEIGNDFLYGCTGLTTLDLSPLSNLRSIGDYFLCDCTGLTTLYLSFLSNLRSIGDYFLCDCTGLTTLDLSSLSNVREIRNCFLFGCAGLTTLDLSFLSKVREIGGAFLFGCAGLTTLDLSSLSNVTNIGDYFLSGCAGLTALDLRPLSNVTNIECCFLSGCVGLTRLDLSSLSKVREIGGSFLFGCAGLRTLDLSPISNVTNIGHYILSSCAGLTRERVTVPQNWRFEDRLPENLRQPRAVQQPAPRVEAAEPAQNAGPASANAQRMINDVKEPRIDLKRPGSEIIREMKEEFRRDQDAAQNEGRVSYQDFMQMTDEQIKTVRAVVIPLSESYFTDKIRDALNSRLSKNKNITVILDCADATRIEDKCLYNIDMMRKLQIIHAEKVRSIGNNFFRSCSGLTTVDFGSLSNVENIGDHFLSFCLGLTMVDFGSLLNVTSIGDYFLSDCRGLTTLDLRPLSNVTHIGDYFLCDCTGLTMLDLTPLSNAREIGDRFLDGCSRLTREHVTRPQNWRFEDRLPYDLMQPRAVQ
ncbi:MAG: hypothetical protein NEHIOOID_00278 [Holosporales bacterium]